MVGFDLEQDDPVYYWRYDGNCHFLAVHTIEGYYLLRYLKRNWVSVGHSDLEA